MSNNNEHESPQDTARWLSAGDAAEILKMTPRQVHRYGVSEHIRTRRAGQRVLYHSGDVAKLADDLHVDIRPTRQRTDPLNEALDLAKRQYFDIAEGLRRQQATFEELRLGQQQTQEEMREEQHRTQETLRRLEERITAPAPTPRWVLIGLVLLGIIAAALIILALKAVIA